MAQGFGAPVDSLDVRRTRFSEKWRRHAPDVLASFIAEMDLPVAPELVAAMSAQLEQGADLGYAYTFAGDSSAQTALSRWLTTHFSWTVPAHEILFFADVMRVIEAGIEAFTSPGDAVVFDVPAYPGFFDAVRERGRELVPNPMVLRNGSWQIDLNGLRRAFRSGARAYILCSPHNPTGRVHEPQQLVRIAELASAHDVTVLCDEVHSPLVYRGRRHTPFASLAPEVRTLTAIAASKGWNIAGLKCAFGIPSSPSVAEALTALPSRLRDGIGIMGAVANEAAFTVGDRWLHETLSVLDTNRRLLGSQIACLAPEIGFHMPEATYLGWLDCRRAADRLGTGSLAGHVLDTGRLAVSDGTDFGVEGFLRINFATTTPLVEELVRRLITGLAMTDTPAYAELPAA